MLEQNPWRTAKDQPPEEGDYEWRSFRCENCLAPHSIRFPSLHWTLRIREERFQWRHKADKTRIA